MVVDQIIGDHGMRGPVLEGGGLDDPVAQPQRPQLRGREHVRNGGSSRSQLGAVAEQGVVGAAERGGAGRLLAAPGDAGQRFEHDPVGQEGGHLGVVVGG